MDEDDPWLRQPWEDADPPPRQTSGRPAAGTEALLLPLARAQDAVGRFEAAVAAAPAYVAAGLRARLALREAGLTGSLHAGGADRAAQAGGAVDERGGRCGRRRRRPLGSPRGSPMPGSGAGSAKLTTLRPLQSVDSLAAPLVQFGALLPEHEATRAWLAALPGPAALPGLLATARVMASGLPGMPREHRLELAPTYVAAALWRLHGYGWGCALPFWAAPVSRIEALARHGGGEIELGYLDCVAEAAMRGARELDRLLAAARRIAELPGSARSRLPAAAPSPCRSRWSPDACSPVGSMFRRTPVWRAFAIA